MNVENLNTLIAYLKAQPPERINMAWVNVKERSCGTCGCLLGHARVLWPKKGLYAVFPISWRHLFTQIRCVIKLTMTHGYPNEKDGARRYPAHRVIAMLERLRDVYLAAGQVVVDWGPEPGEEPAAPWSAPQVAEVIAPALPAVFTDLLRAPATASEEAAR